MAVVNLMKGDGRRRMQRLYSSSSELTLWFIIINLKYSYSIGMVQSLVGINFDLHLNYTRTYWFWFTYHLLVISDSFEFQLENHPKKNDMIGFSIYL